jgi:hypothetical protein
METTSVINERNTLKKSHENSILNTKNISRDRGLNNSGIVDLISEGGVNLYRYIDNLGLLQESELLVLSSKHHYYYDEKELKHIRTLVTLKKLNHIKYLDLFLKTIVRILPPKVNFIGCFSNDRINTGSGLHYYNPSRLYSRFLNFLDSKADQIMNNNEVSKILKRNGLIMINMTEMNGLTYFCSQNTCNPESLKS